MTEKHSLLSTEMLFLTFFPSSAVSCQKKSTEYVVGIELAYGLLAMPEQKFLVCTGFWSNQPSCRCEWCCRKVRCVDHDAASSSNDHLQEISPWGKLQMFKKNKRLCCQTIIGLLDISQTHPCSSLMPWDLISKTSVWCDQQSVSECQRLSSLFLIPKGLLNQTG